MTRYLLVFLATALLVNAETDYRFAFPQSELLMGVDVKWLLKSPLAEKLKKEAKGGDLEGALSGMAPDELKPLEALLSQVEYVYVSAVSKAPVKGAKAAKGAGTAGSNTDLVIFLKGKFEAEKLVEMAVKNGYRPAEWGKVKVLVPMEAKPKLPGKARVVNAQFKAPFGAENLEKAKPAIAMVDAQRIVIAEEAPLRVALERMETALKPQANPLFERARDLEAENDFWIVGSTAPLNLNAAPAKGAAKDPMAEMVSQIRNFSIGVAVRRNLNLDLQLQATTPKVAGQMHDMARGLLAMAKMNQKPGEEFPVNLDQALQLSASGNIVRASLTLEQNELDKMIAQVGKSMKPGIPGSEQTAANEKQAANENQAEKKAEVAAAPPAPVKPQRKTVMIYGLPGGPKEVPVQ
ncbi:MAG: hypothetical protein NW208_13880 [Bryobacter sp.]|nr:hypothetical protein [Bryobacter sp.]